MEAATQPAPTAPSLRRRRKEPLTGRAREERRLAWILCAPAVIASVLVGLDTALPSYR